MTQMLTAEQYGEAHGASARTVQRWCQAGEVPGAVQDRRGRWSIPQDAIRQDPIPGTAIAATTRQNGAIRHDGDDAAAVPAPGARATLADVLDHSPAFLDLATAAACLGVPESAIRRHRAAFDAKPYGPHGALVVPAHMVRLMAGLPR